jgi:23S rRNA (pseudouridine1915-N3)-methyltransferase
MTWRIITVGKPVFSGAKEAVETYRTRLQNYTKVESVIIKDGPRKQVEEQLLAASEKSLRIILDERGKALRSVELARWVEERQMRGVKVVSLLIGGADGHSEALRQAADMVWTLSPMTLQHEVALVVLFEQLYRAHTILKGEPYHRE